MNENQKWLRKHYRHRFNINNKVRLQSGEIGIIKCLGTDDDIPVYIVEVDPSVTWITVKEHEVESAL
jgi:CTP synthase (UTP-ammonia lyase)